MAGLRHPAPIPPCGDRPSNPSWPASPPQCCTYHPGPLASPQPPASWGSEPMNHTRLGESVNVLGSRARLIPQEPGS
eukprot:6685159-Prymnesium_polylepis.1